MKGTLPCPNRALTIHPEWAQSLGDTRNSHSITLGVHVAPHPWVWKLLLCLPSRVGVEGCVWGGTKDTSSDYKANLLLQKALFLEALVTTSPRSLCPPGKCAGGHRGSPGLCVDFRELSVLVSGKVKQFFPLVPLDTWFSALDGLKGSEGRGMFHLYVKARWVSDLPTHR
jgi:hypothetical protein